MILASLALGPYRKSVVESQAVPEEGLLAQSLALENLAMTNLAVAVGSEQTWEFHSAGDLYCPFGLNCQTGLGTHLGTAVVERAIARNRCRQAPELAERA